MTFFDIPSVQTPKPIPSPRPKPSPSPRPSPNPPQKTPTLYPTPVDPALDDGTRSNWDGDEWEDERVVTPIDDGEQLIASESSSSHASKPPKKSLAGRMHLSASSSVHKPMRLKSRGRQRAQNARAGIKVITDFSGFRKPGTSAQQVRKSPNVSRPKFVDLAALRALEGSPNSASTGSWNWLKRQKSGASPNHLAPSPVDSGLSPADRPIVIGISMDQTAADAREISPQTAVVGTPPGLPPIQTTALSPAGSTTPATPSRLRSVWSPDTPGSANTLELEGRRATSRIYSLYSQITGGPIVPGENTGSFGVPPVPEVPAGFKGQTVKPIGAASEEDVDSGTPCTLFEEDGGVTPRKSRQGRRQTLSHAAHSRSVLSDSIAEWWDGESGAETPRPANGPEESPRPQMRDLTITRAPANTPAVSSPRPHQKEHVAIVVTTATTVVVPSPHLQRDLTGGAAAASTAMVASPGMQRNVTGVPTTTTQKVSEEPKPRILSTVSDAITEFWDDDEPIVQAPATTAAVQPLRVQKTESSRAPAAAQQMSQAEPAQSTWASPAPEPRFPARTNSLAPAPWTLAVEGGESPARNQSPARNRSPGMSQSALREESPARNQASGRNQSPGMNAATRRNQSPGMNATTGRNQSPGMNATTGRNQSPGMNATTGRNQSPGLSQSSGRNQSPGRPAGPRFPLGSATMSSSSPSRVENSRTTNAPVIVEERQVPSEGPPPYSPPRQNLLAPVRIRPVFPPDHPLHGRFPPSPGPISPAMATTMTSQGAVNMTEIPLTPAPQPTTFRDRPAGGFVPAEEYAPVESRQDRVERRRLEEERKREEKERKREERESGGAGGILKLGWRLRNLFPRNQAPAAAAAAPVGQPKKPIWPWVVGAGVIALIILGAVLGTLLTRKGDSNSKPPTRDDSPWVNVPGFPPMPTGILTVVGPENSGALSQCTTPSTLWSCELPKELHDSVSPHDPNQPTVVMQIQLDNTTQSSWDIPNGKPPVPTATAGNARFRRSSTLGRRIEKRLARGISPDPSPPSFEEMYFLGNTTDGIVSDDKAGEPTPFYISLIQSVDDSVGPNRIDKRANAVASRQASNGPPAPELNEDGTAAPARLLPLARQQPVRLYDRGLPTEHYGFYTYFPRTIYVRAVRANDTANIALDEGGGSREEEANFLVTWSETRFLVRLWTNSEGSKSLLAKDDAERPGTMPYPVTMKLDTHGGDAVKKSVWALELDNRKVVNATDRKLLANAIGEGGELVNPRSDKNPSFGGVDGGTGGCMCEWVNFAEK
ncbi:uncharacterized protein DNG_00234 [Cephalotrichum gorgonifer]|uniref:Uncharacterized protein n=1 Tax=Cephalotrichum gorgonifer TaxID=2041049 RepID=A0AAE8MNE9_9PEZI|nr:uncharacterized protein DNG_00234 [Cephalotrichum gorgonifer]